MNLNDDLLEEFDFNIGNRTPSIRYTAVWNGMRSVNNSINFISKLYDNLLKKYEGLFNENMKKQQQRQNDYITSK